MESNIHHRHQENNNNNQKTEQISYVHKCQLFVLPLAEIFNMFFAFFVSRHYSNLHNTIPIFCIIFINSLKYIPLAKM